MHISRLSPDLDERGWRELTELLRDTSARVKASARTGDALGSLEDRVEPVHCLRDSDRVCDSWVIVIVA